MAKVSRNATVVSENAAQMTTLFSATLGGPLVKTAAFTYGVRKAIRATARRRAKRRQDMMRRLFWFALGAGLAIFVFVKVREMSDEGHSRRRIGHRVADVGHAASASRAQDFTARVRAAMAEREDGTPRRRSVCPNEPSRRRPLARTI